MQRKDTRPLTVNGNAWEYKIGINTVAIYDPEGNRYFPRFDDIAPMPPKPMFSFEKNPTLLNPAVIIDYIQKNILADKPMNFCKFCGETKPDVILRVNPFAAEIKEDYTKHFMCNECKNIAAEEI